jgi:DNA repair exonuclease SbcCD ATPase subunit
MNNMEKDKKFQIRLTNKELNEIKAEAEERQMSAADYLIEGHRLLMRERGKCPCCGRELKG